MNMRRFWILVAALAATCPAAINAQDANPPEIVQFESARVLADLLFVTMASTGKRYSLDCHTKNPGCITPLPKTNYLLFDKNARWKMPGAKEFLTLKFVHDWVGTYREDDIGLVPAEGGAPNELGVFVLESVKVR